MVVPVAHFDAARSVDDRERSPQGFRLFGFAVGCVVHRFENAEIKFCCKAFHGVGIHVFPQAHVHRLLPIEQFFDPLFELILVQQTVKKLPLHCVFCRAQGQVFSSLVQPLFRDAPALSNAAAHFRPNVFEQCGQLLSVGGTHAFAGEGLHCAFIFVVRTAKHGHADAELLEHAFVISGLQPHASEVRSTVGMQVQFISS